MLLSFTLSLLLWSGLCLYRNSNGFYFHYREPPHFLIAPLILILSLLSTLLPSFSQPVILFSESALNYLPLSYPFSVDRFTSMNMGMSNWRIWFLTPEIGVTFSLPGFIYSNIVLVNLFIGFCFFLVNYLFTVLLSNLLSSRVMNSSTRLSKTEN
jgi:hypothetical protein